MASRDRVRAGFRVGHVHLKVAHLERSVVFYTGILPLTVTETVNETYAFLSFGESHHDLALQQVGDDAPRPESGSIGLFHTAFEVSNLAALAAIYQNLRDQRVPTLTADYGISRALYVADPDGNGVEIYVDTREHEKGREKWSGATGRLTPEQILRHSDETNE